MEYSIDDIAKKFDSLPEDLQMAIYSADMLANIEAIGKQFTLHVDQIGLLEEATADVMLGILQPQDFPSAIAQRLSLPQTIAESIAEAVNARIFMKVRASLQNMYAKTGGDKNNVPPPPTTPTPEAQIVEKPATAVPAALPAVEHMLTQPTVSTPPPPTPPSPATTSTQPETYKADPYREPVE